MRLVDVDWKQGGQHSSVDLPFNLSILEDELFSNSQYGENIQRIQSINGMRSDESVKNHKGTPLLGVQA